MFINKSNLKSNMCPNKLMIVLNQIKEYLIIKRKEFDLIIDWSVLSSDFQRDAFKKVFAIPYGETRTYAQIAVQIGHPQAFRAMGRANATNPMPLVIPCHRVVGTDGKLHGYGGKGGLKTKAWLLKMEKENCRDFESSVTIIQNLIRILYCWRCL